MVVRQQAAGNRRCIAFPAGGCGSKRIQDIVRIKIVSLSVVCFKIVGFVHVYANVLTLTLICERVAHIYVYVCSQLVGSSSSRSSSCPMSDLTSNLMSRARNWAAAFAIYLSSTCSRRQIRNQSPPAPQHFPAVDQRPAWDKIMQINDRKLKFKWKINEKIKYLTRLLTPKGRR